MSLIKRYVTINKLNSSEAEVKINANFLGFPPVEMSAKKQISEILIGELNNLGLKEY